MTQCRFLHSADLFNESLTKGWIRFDSHDFDEKLLRLVADFSDFVKGPLKQRIYQLFPKLAEEFLTAFTYCFDRLDYSA